MSGTSAGARKGWETRRRHEARSAAPRKKDAPRMEGMLRERAELARLTRDRSATSQVRAQRRAALARLDEQIIRAAEPRKHRRTKA